MREQAKDRRIIHGGPLGIQSLSGPGSISPPPLVAPPNFGVVNQPLLVVRGGFSF